MSRRDCRGRPEIPCYRALPRERRAIPCPNDLPDIVEAGQCFCSLYDKVCWPEALALAYQKAKANKGAPGVGGVTFDEIESYRPVTSTRSVSRAVGSVDLRHRQRHADESQASKAALRSLDLTELLVMSTRTHKPKVSTRLTQVFPPGAPIEEDERAPVPDWDLVQEAHAGLLEASAAEVRRVDKAHRLNKVKLSERRRQRVKLVEELSTRHQDLRHSFSGTYGKDALPLVGLDATPERRPREASVLAAATRLLRGFLHQRTGGGETAQAVL